MEYESRAKSEIIRDIIEFFENNTDAFNECIEELDSYNGYLGDDRYYPMDEIEEILSGMGIEDVLNRSFFGEDEDTHTTDGHGNTEHPSFNPCRDWFRFNAYGNLASTDYKDYSAYIDEYAVESMVYNSRYVADRITDYPELANLFDELVNA